MSRPRVILEYIRRSSVWKYAIVLVVGIVVVGFLDDNSIWSHIRNKQKISELKSEINLHRSRYERDKAQLRQLDRDPKAIEKIARERYFMKAEGEDIFVLSDDTDDEETQYIGDETTE